MAIMTHAKFHCNWLMLTPIFGIWASEPPPRAWRTTEKAGPDRVNANWTLEAPKKQLYHSCRKQVVSASVIFIIKLS